MMNLMLRMFLFLPMLLLLACGQSQAAKTTAKTPLQSTPQSASSIGGDLAGQIADLRQRFVRLKKGDKAVIRITQFGDSHTAADFFTGRLRDVLQRRYGDAGIGWIAPLRVRGQRHAKITYEQDGWTLYNSRRDAYPNYPMGGYVAGADEDDAKVRIKLRTPNPRQQWTMKVLYREVSSNNAPWKTLHGQTTLPTDYYAHGSNTRIGGIRLEKTRGKGVIVEPIAANGAQNTLWDSWGRDWYLRDLSALDSDLVILSYGTNEAFDDHFSATAFRRDMTKRVRQVREALPDSLILIMGAPESYRYLSSGASINGDCEAQRPSPLTTIQQIQAEVAEQQNTLYWDWQAAMGGRCQVNNLIADGLMQKDGVHFTRNGYELGADYLLAYLKNISLIQ